MSVQQFLDANGVIQVVSPTNPLPSTGSGGGGGTASAVKIWDGTTSAAVKGASTAPVAADAALVVTPSPSGLFRLVGADGVTLLGPANRLPVDAPLPSDVVASGSLGALNATLTLTAGPRDTVVAAVSGTFVGTLSLQGSLDNSTWFTINGPATWLNVATGASVTAITTTGLWQATISAVPYVRLAMTAYTSGTAAIALDATDGNAMVALDAPLPAGTAVIGKAVLADQGSNNVGVKVGANAAATSDNALVVALSPNSPLPAGSAGTTIGAVGAATNGESGSLAVLNATVGGVSDLANLGQVQVQITNTWSGQVTFQVSLDGTNWVTKGLASISPGAGSSLAGTVTTNGVWFGHIGARYFRVQMTSYTSGTASVVIRYNAAPGDMPITSLGLRSNASADGIALNALDEVALAAYNGTSIDRIRTAGGAGAGAAALAVATGNNPQTSIAAATAPTSGGTAGLGAARNSHTIQVDIATTTAGTAGTHSVVLEGSLDGTYWTTLATLSPAATSTNATDATNHASASVTGAPWSNVRARWASIPTSWVGTLTARVASA